MAPPNADNPSDVVARFRCDNGLCPYCGTSIYEITVDTLTNSRIVRPLTEEGVVKGGRCLFCYPDNPVSALDAGADADGVDASVRAAFPTDHAEATARPDFVGSSPAVVTVAGLSTPSSSTGRKSQSTSTTSDDPQTPGSLISDMTEDGPSRIHTPTHHDGDSESLTNRAQSRGNRKRCKSDDQDDTNNVCDNSDKQRNIEENSRASHGPIITPGFRKISHDEIESDDDNGVSGNGNKRRIHLKIQDDEGREFLGHLTSGTTKNGNGRFEYRHTDDSDNEGKVSIYQGQFCSFKAKGKETLLIHGRGKYTHASGSVHEGQYKRGAAHGTGTCLWPNGWSYEGEWAYDQRLRGKSFECTKSGKVREHGEIYEGEFENDARHGHGRLTLRDGTRIVGQFANNEIHGQAEYYFTDGSIYIGQFKEGYRSGHGRMVYFDKSTYQGKWKDNERNGQGTLVEADGKKFVGIFKDDCKWSGTLYHLDNTTEEYVRGKRSKKKRKLSSM